jgi:hypothetical protein
MKRGTRVEVLNLSGHFGSMVRKEFHVLVVEPFEGKKLKAVLFDYNDARSYAKWLRTTLGGK